MTILVPRQKDFDLLKGKIQEGMQMRCPGICRCSCTACNSCRCTPCRHSLGTKVTTRKRR